MKQFNINHHTISFDPENHRYFVDGIRIASIGDIVDALMHKNFKRVAPERLQKAAEKGLALRERIIQYESHAIKTYHVEMQSYIALKQQHQFDVKASDVLVLLHEHGKIVAAGQVAMIVDSPYIRGKGIAAIKRMAHFDEKRLTLQLNLYKLAYEQTYKRRLDYIKCIHIRNRTYRYVDVPVDLSVAKNALKTYLKMHPLDASIWFE